MPAVVLTDAFWRSKLGADARAVGRTIRLDGQPALVVGVLPQEFHFDYPTLRIPEPVDMYLSYSVGPSATLGMHGDSATVPVLVLARLREGVTYRQAQSELQTLEQTFARGFPSAIAAARTKWVPQLLQVLPLREAIIARRRSLLWLLLGGVGALLLIACANTAQLLLARSLQRGREVVIRIAVGATRQRLIRQFLLEGLLLAVCGGAAGLTACGWIMRLLVARLPVRSPLLEVVRLDLQVLGFTLAVSVISAIGFAILPALKASRWTPGPSLNAGAAAVESNQWRNLMIAIEATLSVFLLCAAALVTQNLWTLISSPMGFDPNHVLAMQLKLQGRQQNALDPQASQALQGYLDKIAAIPGVDSAATVTGPPLRHARGGPSELVGVTNEAGVLKSVMGDNHLARLLPHAAHSITRRAHVPR